MHTLLPIQLSLLLCFLFGDLLLDGIQLLFLSLADGLSSCLAIGGLFQNFLLTLLIKLSLPIRCHAWPHYDDLVCLSILVYFRCERAPSVEILGRPVG